MVKNKDDNIHKKVKFKTNRQYEEPNLTNIVSLRFPFKTSN